MKICFIRHPGSIHAKRWIEYFTRKGHEMHVIYFKGDFGTGLEVDKHFPELVQLENVHIHCVKGFDYRFEIKFVTYLLNTIMKVRNLRRKIKEIAPDVVDAHTLNYYGWLGALSGFHPFAATAWGSDVLIAPTQSPLLRILIKYALKKADLITCSGENVEEEMIKLGADSEKIHLIYHGVDTRSFSPTQKDRALRMKLKIFDSPAIISVRNLTPIYDVESLIRAIPLVLRQIPEVKFIIAGDGEQRDYLEKLATSSGIAGSVRFIGWILHDELPKYLTSADIYVSTSLSDTLSVSLQEAMACALPVVVTDSGDNRIWIRDGENGCVVPVKSPDVLASKIIHLLQNENVMHRFAQANRQIVKEKADYDKNMGKMEKLYEGLLERSKR